MEKNPYVLGDASQSGDAKQSSGWQSIICLLLGFVHILLGMFFVFVTVLHGTRVIAGLVPSARFPSPFDVGVFIVALVCTIIAFYTALLWVRKKVRTALIGTLLTPILFLGVPRLLLFLPNAW